GFGGSDVSVPLDPRYVGPAHVGDVFVLIPDFFDRERDDLQAHLVHIVGAGGAHAVTHHFGLLHNLFHCELANDTAQMAFQDQADEPLALLWRFGKKLFGGSLNRFGIGFNFDLCDGFHRDRDALSSIEILLGRDVERHQLQREHLPILHHRKNYGAAPLDDAGAAETIDHECL